MLYTTSLKTTCLLLLNSPVPVFRSVVTYLFKTAPYYYAENTTKQLHLPVRNTLSGHTEFPYRKLLPNWRWTTGRCRFALVGMFFRPALTILCQSNDKVKAKGLVYGDPNSCLEALITQPGNAFIPSSLMAIPLPVLDKVNKAGVLTYDTQCKLFEK